VTNSKTTALTWRQKGQAKWEALPSTTRQRGVKFGVGLGVLLVVWLSYYGTGEAQKRNTTVAQLVKRKLNLGGDLLKDDIQEKVKNDLKQQNDLIGEQNQRVSHIEEVLPAIQEELSRLKREESEQGTATIASTSEKSARNVVAGDVSYPPSPNYQPPPGYEQLPNAVATVPEIQEEIIGGVGHSIGQVHKVKPAVKKRKGFYLAPGFMDAQLLHGIEAYTSEGAMANPEPLLIRVQAPAVLPNAIRAQLTGCFVMANVHGSLANVHGSLAKERVEGQVVNLTCLSPDGTAVIDQEVLGYVVDNDGQKGLAATIVSKMGQHVSRSFIAGLAGGFGEGISASGLQNNITGAGQVQTFEPGKVGRSALGQGLSSASQDIKKLFLELARQTLPVAEVEAARRCSVVLQKGVELIIRERDVW
jgi:conjugal transfer pilus assembly protein TraB